MFLPRSCTWVISSTLMLSSAWYRTRFPCGRLYHSPPLQLASDGQVQLFIIYYITHRYSRLYLPHTDLMLYFLMHSLLIHSQQYILQTSFCLSFPSSLTSKTPSSFDLISSYFSTLLNPHPHAFLLYLSGLVQGPLKHSSCHQHCSSESHSLESPGLPDPGSDLNMACSLTEPFSVYRHLWSQELVS